MDTPTLYFKITMVVILFLLIWIICISFIALQAFNHYNKLIKVTGKGNLKDVLEKLLNKLAENEGEIKNLKESHETLEKKSWFFLQQIRFVRFNPFSDTGGDQSFILAILDGLKNGIIINSLHSRTGTRWYAKKIKRGKSEEYELSREEEKILLEPIVQL